MNGNSIKANKKTKNQKRRERRKRIRKWNKSKIQQTIHVNEQESNKKSKSQKRRERRDKISKVNNVYVPQQQKYVPISITAKLSMYIMDIHDIQIIFEK